MLDEYRLSKAIPDWECECQLYRLLKLFWEGMAFCVQESHVIAACAAQFPAHLRPTLSGAGQVLLHKVHTDLEDNTPSH